MYPFWRWQRVPQADAACGSMHGCAIKHNSHFQRVLFYSLVFNAQSHVIFSHKPQNGIFFFFQMFI